VYHLLDMDTSSGPSLLPDQVSTKPGDVHSPFLLKEITVTGDYIKRRGSVEQKIVGEKGRHGRGASFTPLIFIDGHSPALYTRGESDSPAERVMEKEPKGKRRKGKTK